MDLYAPLSTEKKPLVSRDVEKSAQTMHSSKSKRQQQLLLPLLNPNSGQTSYGQMSFWANVSGHTSYMG
jgi:hypothetical protein